jgi:hypothetical protein
MVIVNVRTVVMNLLAAHQNVIRHTIVVRVEIVYLSIVTAIVSVTVQTVPMKHLVRLEPVDLDSINVHPTVIVYRYKQNVINNATVLIVPMNIIAHAPVINLNVR